MRRLPTLPFCVIPILLVSNSDAAPRSHLALRVAPPASNRPLDKGPAYYVDAGKGDDRNDGSKESPWRSVNHGLRRLRPGDTLVLRGGTYYENVYVALTGRKDAPITIRSAPGEQAVIDGGLREFFENPEQAWEAVPGGAAGEFRSKNRHPNLRTVIGSFGDSMVGLQTYYHAKDLRSTNELVEWEGADPATSDVKPLYCGPGVWFDRETGHVHSRLAHTNLPEPVPNYRGETDPRKLPLVLAAFNSVPLTFDEAKHVRVQDLVVRGAGYTALRFEQAENVEVDNVTVWCGTYGAQMSGTRGLKLHRCGFYGSVAPWTFRTDTSKRDYPDRPHRNITRLNTHAHFELDAGRESSVYAYPQNDQWEISYCEFTEGHDGPYLGAVNVRFHHNLIDGTQDDGIYLSPMYHRHKLEKTDPEIHIYQNVFRGMLTALAFGGTETVTNDKVFIYRNLFDLRARVLTGRPGGKRSEIGVSTGKVIGDHGSPPWSAMNIYHNTFVMSEGARTADMATLGSTKAGHPRRVFNNVFLHTTRLPAYAGPAAGTDVAEDGNLYWAPGVQEKVADSFFQRFRASPAFAEGKKVYPAGSSSGSRVADPKLGEGLQPQEGSAVVNGGVALPEAWPDPLRKDDKGKPDVGALPVGVDLKVGRGAAGEK